MRGNSREGDGEGAALPLWSAACNPSHLKLKNDISQPWFSAPAVTNDKKLAVFLRPLVFHNRLLSNYTPGFLPSKDTVRLLSVSSLGQKPLCYLLAGYVTRFERLPTFHIISSSMTKCSESYAKHSILIWHLWRDTRSYYQSMYMGKIQRFDVVADLDSECEMEPP